MTWWRRPWVKELCGMFVIVLVVQTSGYAVGVFHGGFVEAFWMGVALGAAGQWGRFVERNEIEKREQRRAR